MGHRQDLEAVKEHFSLPQRVLYHIVATRLTKGCTTMHTCRHSLHCFVPPHVLEKLAESSDKKLRDIGIAGIEMSAAAHSTRAVMSKMPFMSAIPSPAAKKYRLVYDLEHSKYGLPGKLVRSEGEGPVGDDAVNEAYDFSGVTVDCYAKLFKRNSIDDKGLTLVSSVHHGTNVSNAFWNGEQMIYGDGDGRLFLSFTRSLEVVAHELTHGVTMYESNLVYENESGALNESFSDVMGAIVEQWHKKQSVNDASWLMGDELFNPELGIKGIRQFMEGPAYENHPELGTDPQRKHMNDKYTGLSDYGGVHINSGIPNLAFYRVAMELGGNSWDKAGPIWYVTLRNLRRYSSFQDCADMTFQVAVSRHGQGSREQEVVAKAWDGVGITVGVLIG